MTRTKDHMYSTAKVVESLPGIEAGEYVNIVRYHDYNDTFTIRSIAGVLQCMVSRSCLADFCL